MQTRRVALGVVAGAGRPGPGRVAAPVDHVPDSVLDVGALAAATGGPYPDLLREPSLDGLLAAGRPAWREVTQWLVAALADPDRLAEHLLPAAGVVPVLPFTVADYVDFFACEQHARNAGLIFRPDAEPLMPNWKHLPVGYHGRAGTVRVSGSPVVRPVGQRGPGDVGPSAALDLEAEVGYVLGGPATVPGAPVPMAEALEHVVGVVLLNDWSARDVQAFESRPLGPMLGKAFATSVSAWVTPLDALEAAWVDPPARDPEPAAYLRGVADRGLDLALEVRLNAHVVARPPAADLYWTPAQLVAHLTSGGATLRPGDLLGSGTVSGRARDCWGSLLELTWGGRDPLALPDGTTRTYLEDGDEVTITATAPAADGGRLALGPVSGRVAPAPVPAPPG